MRITHPYSAALAAVVAFAAAPNAQAIEPRLSLGASGAASSWRGDAAAYASLALGARFADFAGIYARAESGYGVVDGRLLGLLSLGGQLWGRIGVARPYVRASLLHQHEESLSVVANDSLRAAFGVGDGIRHRAGGEVAVGVEVPLIAETDTTVFASVDAFAKVFPDELGPRGYVGAGLAIGASFDLGGGT